MPKLAIFDMDGTLVTFSIDAKGARADVIDHLVALGIPREILQVKNSILDLKVLAKQHVAATGEPKIDWEQAGADVLAIIDGYEQAAAEVSQPIDGVQDVLSELEQSRILMAVCTLNSTSNATAIFRKFSLDRYFALVAGRDMVGDRRKPNPAHGLFILDKLGVQPADACMIGDHPSDMEMAGGMGIKGVGIVNERHPEADFERFEGIRLVSDKDYSSLASVIKEQLELA
jgi:HAD superfamily hydrolase (TIGR01549 family)